MSLHWIRPVQALLFIRIDDRLSQVSNNEKERIYCCNP